MIKVLFPLSKSITIRFPLGHQLVYPFLQILLYTSCLSHYSTAVILPHSHSHKDWVKFKSKETQYGKPDRKLEVKKSLPGDARDWKMLWDEDKYPAHFPQHIYNTAERPDIVVWSDSSKQVILIELTCGDESTSVTKYEERKIDTIES